MRRHAITLAMLSLLAAALPVVGCASGATSSTSADATAPPLVTRTLRFETPADLDAWVIHGGEWKVEDGHAVGRSLYPATERYSWLTYRTFYGEIRRVVVHAALDGGSPHNLRIGVGAMTIVLNWEGGDMNLVHYRGPDTTEVPPRALVPGRESEIVVEHVADRLRLVVDGRLLWEDEGRLSGTVTLYPLLGSTIRVRDVTITGRAVPWVDVDFPSLPHF